MPARQPNILIHDATVAANGADFTAYLLKVPTGQYLEVVGWDLTAGTTIATQGTNYITITLQRVRSGTPTTIATTTTNSSGGAAITAGTMTSPTISTTQATYTLQGGDYLAINFDYATGTHVALDHLVSSIRILQNESINRN